MESFEFKEEPPRLDMRREAKKVITANGYGLVVMTLASHARGRGFDPLFPYAFLPEASLCQFAGKSEWAELLLKFMIGFDQNYFAELGSSVAAL